MKYSTLYELQSIQDPSLAPIGILAATHLEALLKSMYGVDDLMQLDSAYSSNPGFLYNYLGSNGITIATEPKDFDLLKIDGVYMTDFAAMINNEVFCAVVITNSVGGDIVFSKASLAYNVLPVELTTEGVEFCAYL